MAVEIKPIRTEADYEAALAAIEQLWGAPAGTPEGDRLDVLATLVDAYEAARHPIDPPDPIAAIAFRMEQQGLEARDLAPIIGSISEVTEILQRRRPLSLEMIRRLHEHFDIAAEILIRPIRQDDVA
jgi:HTH-type transcriptional regulator / antitoxin HigA